MDLSILESRTKFPVGVLFRVCLRSLLLLGRSNWILGPMYSNSQHAAKKISVHT